MTRIAGDRRIAEEIGVRVRARRRWLGVSQRAIAEKTGCTEAMISHIEIGREHPGCRLIPPLCQALLISPNDLFGW